MTLKDPKPRCQGQAIFDAEYLQNGCRYSHSYYDITDTNVFKKRLKTVLFDRAYCVWLVVVRRSWTVRRAAPYKSLIVFVFCICMEGE